MRSNRLAIAVIAAAAALAALAAVPGLAAPGETTRVSVSSNGTQGNSVSGFFVSVSGDGRFVAFRSISSNLVPGDTNGDSDIFVRDRSAGTTERVTVTSASAQVFGFHTSPAISASGRFVAFYSESPGLVPGDTNGAGDIFVRDRTTGTTERVNVASDGLQVDAFSFSPSISADGRYVAFSSFGT